MTAAPSPIVHDPRQVDLEELCPKGKALVVHDRDAVEIGELLARSDAGFAAASRKIAEAVADRLTAGRRLIAKKEIVGEGNWLAWLEENADVLGHADRRRAAKLMKAAREYPWAVDGPLSETEALTVSRALWGNGGRKAICSLYTGDDRWFSPARYVEAGRACMGSIDTDPASEAAAQAVVKAGVFYSREVDGLQQHWRGNVWLNPPFATGVIEQFIDKLIASYTSGDVTAAILLTNNSTDTQWWLRAARAATAVCFTEGRVAFWKPERIVQPANGQCFFYFGPELAAFAREFKQFGLIVPLGDRLE